MRPGECRVAKCNARVELIAFLWAVLHPAGAVSKAVDIWLVNLP